MARQVTDRIEEEATEILKRPYSWVVVPDDGEFSAQILEFPGCFTCGSTPAEAYENLRVAALGWIQDVLEKGGKVPAPLPQSEHSGKFLLRLPRSLHARAVKVAAKEGVSLNHFISNAVAEKVSNLSAVTEGTLMVTAMFSRTFIADSAASVSNLEWSNLPVGMPVISLSGALPDTGKTS